MSKTPELIRCLEIADHGLSVAEKALSSAYTQLMEQGVHSVDVAIATVSDAHREVLALYLDLQRQRSLVEDIAPPGLL